MKERFSLANRIILQRVVRLRSLHRDERGAISIMSVVTIFVLTVVLGMVVNAGRQVDEKVRMQNAADAATYSGSVVIARGYNALAFANHVEAEVFSLTAYMRAGRDAGPKKDPTTLNFEYSILDAWNRVGSIFAQSQFPKFAALGPAIQQKVPLEKEAVRSFLTMTELQSALVLPVFEYILRGPDAQQPGLDPQGGVIPRFQRAVVLTTPQAAQTMASEIARMHGNMTTTGKMSGLEKLHRRQPLTAILWRTTALPISMGNEQDPTQRTLPVFDPNPFPQNPDSVAYSQDYYELARCQRRRWAQQTLNTWNGYLLGTFARGWGGYWNGYPPPVVNPGGATTAKMSTLYPIWRIFTCGQLNQLLDVEYHGTNLPFMYRMAGPPFDSNQQCTQCQQPNQPGVFDCDCIEGRNRLRQNGQVLMPPGYRQLVYENMDPMQTSTWNLERYHTLVGVAYWPAMQQTSPTFFRYPLAMDSMAFAQASVFVPKARYVKSGPWMGDGNWMINEYITDPTTGLPFWAKRNAYDFNVEYWPQEWDPLQLVHPINLQWVPVWSLENQNWMAKLVPATSDSVPSILQSSQAQQFVPGVRIPNLGGLSPIDLRRINTH